MRQTFGSSSLKGSINYDDTIWKRLKAQIENDYTRRVVGLLTHLNRTVSLNTAVWSGETLVNWKWSTGSPDLNHREPVDNGPPGHTGLPNAEYGVPPNAHEPRRGPNQEILNANFMLLIQAINRKVPSHIYLTNTGEVAEEMEFGSVPTVDRARTRGMLRLAVREAIIFRANLGRLSSVGPLY